MIKLYLACNGVLHDYYDSYHYRFGFCFVIPRSFYQLKQIQPDDYNLVKKISLNYCRINSITDDCFEGLDHLELLSLLGINIKHLKAYKFNPLVSLKYLWLRCSEVLIIEGFFQSEQLIEVMIDNGVLPLCIMMSENYKM